MTYLNFKAYIANDIASLNNMYIQLTDVSGKKLYGFLDANKVKDTVLSGNAWSKVTVILDKLTAESGFDKTKISTISFSIISSAMFTLMISSLKMMLLP